MQTINAKSKATFTAASVPAVSAASREHKKLVDLPKAAKARRRFRTLGAGREDAKFQRTKRIDTGT